MPVVTVGLGTENAGAGSRDIMLRDIVAGPTVFVKNHLEVQGTLVARGFANQTLDVELFVEDMPTPVAKTKVKVPDGGDVIPITGLKYIPQTPGEKKLTLKVAPQDGELVKSNNEISTFVTVLSGGLNVLFLQGSNFTWDYKYMMLLDRHLARHPGRGRGDPGAGARARTARSTTPSSRRAATTSIVLSDLPADFLTPTQQQPAGRGREEGGGPHDARRPFQLRRRRLGRYAAWRTSCPSRSIPATASSSPRAASSSSPTTEGLDSYVLQVGANRTETARIWDLMPPILGTNRFGELKPAANILAETPGPNPEPLMLSMDVGKGRSIAYGGDTWVWARSSEESRLAHRKFWRQVIFWLSHKENEGDNQVKLTLDRRRIAVGEKIELTVTARDAKGAPIPNVHYETKVEREKADPRSPTRSSSTTRERKARARSTPPRRSASPAITRSPSSPSGTARRSAATRPGSSSTRTTASSRTPPPT